MQHAGSFVVVFAVLLFAMYRRARRTMGFQRISRGRIATRMAVFVALGIVIVAMNSSSPYGLLADAVGLLLGAGLAYVAMQTTQFEYRDGTCGYRQNMWVGMTILAVFLGRIIYRYYEMMSAGAPQIHPGDAANANPLASAGYTDPWTAGVFFVLVAYYVAFFVFLLIKEKSLRTALENEKEG